MEEREKRDLIECMSKVHEVTKNNARAIGIFSESRSNNSWAIVECTRAIEGLTDAIDRLVKSTEPVEEED